MILLTIGPVLLGVFALRFYLDRRRISNAIYLFAGLAVTGAGLIGSGGVMDRSLTLTRALIVASTLVVLALAGVLLANSVQMARREGMRLANLLTIGPGVVLLIPYLVLGVAIATDSLWPVLLVMLFVVGGYFGFVFACFVLYSLLYGRLPYQPGMDAIVVHGSGLSGARVPPLLAARLDRAIQIYGEEVAQGRKPVIIASGGKGSDEAVSEASAMADYLIARGVPTESVGLEQQSTTTRENLLFIKRLLGERGTNIRMVLVTSNFHILRTAILARRLKLDAEVTGARTAFYYLPSAVLREFVAILVAYRWTNIVAFVVVVVALPLLLRR
ncbi:YdcF family protein [Nocardia sp. XZ_19_385]|uniref:YdcF family protein n=1 Tax=Nocardia sp. XZ_19_385 TaxID=2769488 RepID=UPI00188F3EB2|nr:YdcF family protein [Nocardia sp. XZ_19_385]